MNALDDILLLREILEKSRRIVFFGGAGVSTASGIPDFRSDEGLQSMGPDPEEVLSKTFFYLQPEAFFDYYRKYLLHPGAKPNAVHRYLFELEKQDKLRGIVTQNVDGLHKAAGNIRVYELHGNVHENHCMECGAAYPDGGRAGGGRYSPLRMRRGDQTGRGALRGAAAEVCVHRGAAGDHERGYADRRGNEPGGGAGGVHDRRLQGKAPGGHQQNADESG